MCERVRVCVRLLCHITSVWNWCYFYCPRFHTTAPININVGEKYEGEFRSLTGRRTTRYQVCDAYPVTASTYIRVIDIQVLPVG